MIACTSKPGNEYPSDSRRRRLPDCVMPHDAEIRSAPKPKKPNVHACFRCYDPPKLPTRFPEDPKYSTKEIQLMNSSLSQPTLTLPKSDMKNVVTGRIFFLDLAGGRVLSANPDGSDLTTLVMEGRKFPDGLAVDTAAGQMYWTNMGNFKENDGSIFRSDLDGG